VTEVLVTRQSLHAAFRTSANSSAGMCDMLTSANYANVESALVSGTMPTDSHSILLDTNNHKYYDDMNVGSVLELSLGSKTVTKIETFDYSWRIVSDPKKAKGVENGLQEIVSQHSNLGLDTQTVLRR